MKVTRTKLMRIGHKKIVSRLIKAGEIFFILSSPHGFLHIPEREANRFTMNQLFSNGQRSTISSIKILHLYNVDNVHIFYTSLLHPDESIVFGVFDEVLDKSFNN